MNNAMGRYRGIDEQFGYIYKEVRNWFYYIFDLYICITRLSALIKFYIFAVQECTTDSEELIYHQVRASSSCSAPPDLLLVSDRENNLPLRPGMVTSANKLVTPPSTCTNTCPVITSSNNNQKNSHRDQPIHKQSSSSYNGSNDSNGKLQQKNLCHRLLSDTLDNDIQVDTQHNNSSSHRSHHQQRSEEHIRLEVSRSCLKKWHRFLSINVQISICRCTVMKV